MTMSELAAGWKTTPLVLRVQVQGGHGAGREGIHLVLVFFHRYHLHKIKLANGENDGTEYGAKGAQGAADDQKGFTFKTHSAPLSGQKPWRWRRTACG